mmetsp:Transcript_1753/g.5120  ORF Transcript_1753/g.5120 Transcript_1753/m.5120 type:complete len:220 (-) Transcript_1753:86-745(-)
MERRTSAPEDGIGKKKVRFFDLFDVDDGQQQTEECGEATACASTIREIKALDDMSKEEKAAIWYMPDDFNSIRIDMKRNIKAYRRLWTSAPISMAAEDATVDNRTKMPRRFSQGDADDVEICIRGLEHLISERVLRSRVEEQSSVIQAVLSLQRDRQSAALGTMGSSATASASKLGSIHDDDRTNRSMLLALSYSTLTRNACQRAHSTAKADEAEANQP